MARPLTPPDLERLDAVFALAVSGHKRAPGVEAPKRLQPLFQQLAMARPPRPADDIEELIWAIWIGHREARAAASMAVIAETIARGDMDFARPMLDDLIRDYPGWSEAWNKRATLHFIAAEDGAAITDIGETLRLEPRHFGALAGFGQICLRNDRPFEARALFLTALRINPHLRGLAAVAQDIRRAHRGLH